jgi:hypothetical protein
MSTVAKGTFSVEMKPQAETSVIYGTFRFEIVDGKHLCEFEYALPQ